MWSPAGGDKPRPYIAAFEDIPRRGDPCGRPRAGTSPAPTLQPLKTSHVGAGTPGRPLLPLRGNSPSALIGPRQLSSTLAVGAALVAAPTLQPLKTSHVGADTPGRPLLPLWGNSPSALIGPRQLSSTLAAGAALAVARGRGQAPPLHWCGVRPAFGAPTRTQRSGSRGEKEPQRKE